MIELRRISREELPDLYKIIYSSENPMWAQLNAPYFKEYKYRTYENFVISNEASFLLKERVRGIYINDEIIGVVTKYWECKETLWLEVGIVIYDEEKWGLGYGASALKLWIEDCFKSYPEIARVGLTTWSGNKGMMKVSEKLGMKLEARLRKVRYYEGYYYDSVKYGILREEFFHI